MKTDSHAADAARAAQTIPESLPPVSLPGDPAPSPQAGDGREQSSADSAAADPAAAEPAADTEEAGAEPAVLLAEISRVVRELADVTDRYHARAEQRESVIDHLHAETERLRRGERRGLLRPLLVEMSRLRNDLLRQAGELPADFDADRARVLLCSFADSVELALEDSGVVTFEPAPGDPFEPRMHRRVGGEPTADAALAGRVARVQRAGYLDVDAGSPIAPAEVLLYSPAARDSSTPAPPATDERTQL
jgi:molecular chaperone GrpE